MRAYIKVPAFVFGPAVLLAWGTGFFTMMGGFLIVVPLFIVTIAGALLRLNSWWMPIVIALVALVTIPFAKWVSDYDARNDDKVGKAAFSGLLAWAAAVAVYWVYTTYLS